MPWSPLDPGKPKKPFEYLAQNVALHATRFLLPPGHTDTLSHGYTRLLPTTYMHSTKKLPNFSRREGGDPKLTLPCPKTQESCSTDRKGCTRGQSKQPKTEGILDACVYKLGTPVLYKFACFCASSKVLGNPVPPHTPRNSRLPTATHSKTRP